MAAALGHRADTDTAGGSPLAVAVVPMRRWHLRQVLGIERRVYPRAWSPALFAGELAAPQTRRYLVAVAPRSRLLPWRRVLGYAGTQVLAGEAHITTVAVHPRFHRRKIATRLLLAVLREAIALGAHAATLEVRASNLGAQRLYAAFGFVPAGVRRGYYQETGEDAVIMWAHGLQQPAYAARLADQDARLGTPGGASGVPDYDMPWVRDRSGLTSRRGGGQSPAGPEGAA